jgi:hypothetical protein
MSNESTEHSRADASSSGADRHPPRPRVRLPRALLRDLSAHGLAYVGRKTLAVVRRERQRLRYRWNLRSLRYDPDDLRLDRPIFFLGTQGGGGTILARCLQRHPKTVYASGNSDFWAAPNEIHNCSQLQHDVPEALRHRSYHFGTVDDRMERHPRYGYQRSWLYAIDEFLPRYRKGADDVDDETTRAFRRVLKKIILAYAHDPRDCRLVDQSQLYTILVPYIARMLADSDPRFVLVSRNPYAICSRAVRKEYTAARGGYIESDRAARIACAVEHWSNSFRLALEASREVPMLTVRYEDFLDDPERVVRGICAFAELEFTSDLVPAEGQRVPLGSVEPEKWYPLKRGENARYLEDLDRDLVDALHRRAGDLFEVLGYERLPER